MTEIIPQLAVTLLVVVECWVPVEPPIEPLSPPLGETVSLLFPPLASPPAEGLQVMVTSPACTVLLADGEEVAFESPALAVPFAVGVECELASPPVVLPVVLELLFALDPPAEESLPDAVALLVPPLVLPVVDEFALEPEPLTSAVPVTLGEASALELPVVALLVPDIRTLVVPPLALSVLDVFCVWVALDPPCDPSPLPDGDTFTVLLPPLALPLAIGLIRMLT